MPEAIREGKVSSIQLLWAHLPSTRWIASALAGVEDLMASVYIVHVPTREDDRLGSFFRSAADASLGRPVHS